MSPNVTSAEVAKELTEWFGGPLLVPVEDELGRCSVCGQPSDDLTGGWAGPWAEAVLIEICPGCRGEE